MSALALADSAKHLAPELAEGHFARGRILTALKRFASADSSYRRALALSPDYRGAWYSLGNSALRQGKPVQAIARFQRSADNHPTAAAFVHMGHAYAELNNPDSAQAAYERALELDSTYAPAAIMMGQLHKERGALEQALAYTRRAWRLKPDDPERMGHKKPPIRFWLAEDPEKRAQNDKHSYPGGKESRHRNHARPFDLKVWMLDKLIWRRGFDALG